MKTFLKTTIALLLSGLVNTFAATVANTVNMSDEVPLGSPDQLLAYAGSKVNRVTAFVYTKSTGKAVTTITGDTYISAEYVAVTMADIIAINALMKRQALTVTFDTTDSFASVVEWGFRDASGRTWSLLRGDKDVKFVTSGSTSTVDPDSYNFRGLLRIGEVPFPAPGAYEAVLNRRDDKGNLVGQPSHLRVDNGNVILEEWQTGQNGELVIYHGDSTQTVYNLPSGKKRPTSTVVLTGYDTSPAGWSTAADNAPVIRYRLSDQVIRANYTITGLTVVANPEAGVSLPTSVRIVDEKTYASNPATGGTVFDPVKAVPMFSSKPGVWFFLIQRPVTSTTPVPSPSPVSGGGGGKG